MCRATKTIRIKFDQMKKFASHVKYFGLHLTTSHKTILMYVWVWILRIGANI